MFRHLGLRLPPRTISAASASSASAAGASTSSSSTSHSHSPSSSNNNNSNNQLNVNVHLLYNMIARNEEDLVFSSQSSSSSPSTRNLRGGGGRAGGERRGGGGGGGGRQVQFVKVTNKPANDLLHAIAQDLRDAVPKENNSSSSSSSSSVTLSRNPLHVCRLISRVCEESNVGRSQQRQRKEKTDLEGEKDKELETRYFIQKQTLISLLLALSRLFEAAENNNQKGNQNQNYNSKILQREAERTIAALTELALFNNNNNNNNNNVLSQLSAPEWFGIVFSLVRLTVLTNNNNSNNNNNSSFSTNTTETQRACAFLLYTALDKLLISNRNSSNTFLLRVRDVLNFSSNLTKILPRAMSVLPDLSESNNNNNNNNNNSNGDNNKLLLEPTWEQCVVSLLKRQALVLEICTSDQCCLMLQNACQLVSSLCNNNNSKSSSRSQEIILKSFADLVEKATERIYATLSLFYDNVETTSREDWKLNVNLALNQSHQLGMTCNNLFGTVIALARVLNTINNNNSDSSSSSSSSQLLSTRFDEMLKLCLFVAKCGPELVNASLAKSQLGQSQSQQQQNQKTLEATSSSSSSTGMSAVNASLPNILASVCHIENSHVSLRNVLSSSSSSTSSSNSSSETNKNNNNNNNSNQDQNISDLVQSQQSYIDATNKALPFLNARGLSTIYNVHHLLQCLSNRIRDSLKIEESIQKKEKLIQEELAQRGKEQEEAEVGEEESDEVVVEEEDEDETVEVTASSPLKTKEQLFIEKFLSSSSSSSSCSSVIVPVILQLLVEVEHRATHDRIARLHLFQLSRSSFDTARRLTVPVFTSRVQQLLLLPLSASSDSSFAEVDWNKNPILFSLLTSCTSSQEKDLGEKEGGDNHNNNKQLVLATAFRGLLRMIKAGLNQKPRPRLGALLQVCSYISSSDCKKCFLLLFSASDSSSTSSAASPLIIRDVLHLDAASVLVEVLKKQNNLDNVKLTELLGLASCLHRMNQSILETRRDDIKEMKLKQQQLLTSQRSTTSSPEQQQEPKQEVVQEAEKENSEKETPEKEKVKPQQEVLDEIDSEEETNLTLLQQWEKSNPQLSLALQRVKESAELLCHDDFGALKIRIKQQLERDEEILSTKMLLSLVQRLLPLSSSTSSSSFSSSSSSLSSQTVAINDLLAYLLLTVLPSRVSNNNSSNQLSALEATLTLSAMQQAKLWRHNVVVSLMRVVTDANKVSSPSSSLKSQEEEEKEENQREKNKNINNAKSAREISVALVSLCQLSSSNAVAGATPTSMSSSSSENQQGGGGGGGDQQQEQKGAVISSLVETLTHKIDAKFVPLQSLLSVWRKLVSATSSASSLEALASLIKSVEEKFVSENRTGKQQQQQEEGTGISRIGDLSVLFNAAENTMRNIVLEPTAGSKKQRNQLAVALRDLVSVIIKSSFEKNNINSVLAQWIANSSSTMTDERDFVLARNLLRVLRGLSNIRVGVFQQEEDQEEEEKKLLISLCEGISKSCWEQRMKPQLELVFATSSPPSSSPSSRFPKLVRSVSKLSGQSEFRDVFHGALSLLHHLRSSSSSSEVIYKNFFQEAFHISKTPMRSEEQKEGEKEVISYSKQQLEIFTKMLSEVFALYSSCCSSSASSSSASSNPEVDSEIRRQLSSLAKDVFTAVIEAEKEFLLVPNEEEQKQLQLQGQPPPQQKKRSELISASSLLALRYLAFTSSFNSSNQEQEEEEEEDLSAPLRQTILRLATLTIPQHHHSSLSAGGGSSAKSVSAINNSKLISEATFAAATFLKNVKQNSKEGEQEEADKKQFLEFEERAKAHIHKLLIVKFGEKETVHQEKLRSVLNL